jgi:hypothetical protein
MDDNGKGVPEASILSSDIYQKAEASSGITA